MNLSAALTADLAVLTQALDDPGLDLEAQLEAVAAAVALAVSSYRAMTMTMMLDGHEVSFTVHQDATEAPEVTTSLLIPLATLTGAPSASSLVLYADTPGAFVDLAADLSFAFGANSPAPVLDAHRPPPTPSCGITGLNGRSVINQAIGMLLDRGHTPESAEEELRRLATLDHGDLAAAAALLLDPAPGGPAADG